MKTSAILIAVSELLASERWARPGSFPTVQGRTLIQAIDAVVEREALPRFSRQRVVDILAKTVTFEAGSDSEKALTAWESTRCYASIQQALACAVTQAQRAEAANGLGPQHRRAGE